MASIRSIDREGIQARMDGEGVVLLEVLGAASYEQGHLPGAHRAQSADEAEGFIPGKDAFVVAYCSDFH